MWVKVVNNEVVEELRHLPKQYKFDDGSTTGNFDSFDNDRLREIGFYPLDNSEKPEIDRTYQTATSGGYDIGTTTVAKIWNIQEISVADHIKKKKRQIEELRQQKESEGFTFNNSLFHSDKLSLQYIMGQLSLLNSGVSLPTDFFWRTKDNGKMSMDEATFKDFAEAAHNYVYNIFLISSTHKDTIESMGTHDAISTHDINANW